MKTKKEYVRTFVLAYLLLRVKTKRRCAKRNFNAKIFYKVWSDIDIANEVRKCNNLLVITKGKIYKVLFLVNCYDSRIYKRARRRN